MKDNRTSRDELIGKLLDDTQKLTDKLSSTSVELLKANATLMTLLERVRRLRVHHPELGKEFFGDLFTD